MPWPEPTASPVSRAAPACRRRSSRTHGACWAAARRCTEPTAPAGTKAAPASASGWVLPAGVSSKSEHEPGAMAPFTPTRNHSSGPPARTAAKRPEHGRGTDHSRDRADHRPGKRIHFATLRKPAPFWRALTRRPLTRVRRLREDGSQEAFRWLVRSPQHERYRGACSSLRFACDLKAVTLVEGDSARVRGFEVSGQVTSVNDLEAGFHQLVTEPFALQGGVDGEPGKVPMRVRRMSCIHLAKDGKHVIMLAGCDGLRERGGNSLTVCFNAWRKPQSSGGESAKTPHCLLTKCPTAKSGKEPGETRQILLRFRVKPALHWVGRES